MMVLLFFSFLAGFATILAPCIWPLLPIVLSASTQGGAKRPFGLTLGVMTSFSLFTLSVSYLESIFKINPDIFRMIAVIVIVLLGVSMLIPALGTQFEVFISRVLQPIQGRLQRQNDETGFVAGYATGFSIGLVWAPCAGPILATIATLAATQAVNFRVFLITLSYVLGLGIPLFAFSQSGAWGFAKMRRISKYTGRIQQVFGLVMIVAALMIYTNYDKTLQLKLLELFPNYGRVLTRIEDNQVVSHQLQQLRGGAAASARSDASSLSDQGPAPEFQGIAQWLNSKPLMMAQLRGKIVLVDFWTYSCINCLRTLPYTKAWYKAYAKDGFVLIGVHTPEFAFEKSTDNVKRALLQFGIEYPVAQDNGYKTWDAYHNSYWPAEYLIDAKGHIRLAHFGEGHYDEMDQAIRELLKEAGRSVNTAASVKQEAVDYAETPETYLGLARLERFASKEPASMGNHVYSFPQALKLNQLALQGPWTLTEEAAKAEKNSSLEIRFSAEKVYLVLSPQHPGDQIALFLDGSPIGAAAGVDVKQDKATLDTQRLYRLVDLKGKPGTHLLRIQFLNDGISAYAFTFG